MFTNDTNLFFKHKNLNDLFDINNIELAKIFIWLKLNKLSLNLKNQFYIIFHNRNKKKLLSKLTIKTDDVSIDQVENTKFLDVIINSNLTWNDHVKCITNKVSTNIGILQRFWFIVPIEILKTL